MTTRAEFPIYQILRTGYVGSEAYSFVVGEDGLSQIIGDGRWRKVGTATAPAGSTLAETKGEEVALFLPGEDIGISATDIALKHGHWVEGVGFREETGE